MADLTMQGMLAGGRRISSQVLVLLALLTLAGCYEVREEVIPATLGEVIPYAADQVGFADGGGGVIFSRSPVNNDYRFRDVADNGLERVGSFRALRIKGNIYAIQARYDDESHYQILFYAINAAELKVLDVAAGTDLHAFAERFGVAYHQGQFANAFSGDPAKILAMLRAFREIDFKP